jgi:hypothetical protein
MTVQYVHHRLNSRRQLRYTLVFRNGEILRHQDSLALAQFRSDARLADVRLEAADQAPLPSRSEG